MLTQQWPTEEHHRATRHYLPNYMLVLVIVVHPKLKTCRLKANRKDSHGVFKLVKSQSKFVKALAEDSKMQKSFCY